MGQDIVANYVENGIPDAPFWLAPWDIAWACYYWRDSETDHGEIIKFPAGWALKRKTMLPD